MMKCKKTIAILLAFILCLTMSLGSTPVFAVGTGDQGGQNSSKKLRLAVLSDLHYMDMAKIPQGEGTPQRDNFLHSEVSESRMMSESALILDQALKNAIKSNPDAMLVCGDMSSNGEYYNNAGVASRLSQAQEEMKENKDGAGIYVINGNHDINNSYAADFITQGTSVENARRTLVKDFLYLYKDLGYGDKVRYFDPAHKVGTEVKSYGALSYATEIADGVTLISLDTNTYGNDSKARFGEAQKTEGSVSDELLRWAEIEAKAANARGNLVLAMCHHAVIPHYVAEKGGMVEKNYQSTTLCPNWQKIAGTLADAGVAAIMTGHSHANDISKYTTKAGNTIYDIQTSSLIAYPCGWRTIDITVSGTGKDKIYDFDIDTKYIESISGINNFKEHSYEKTSLRIKTLEPMADYLLRPTLYEIATNDGGVEKYLKDNVTYEGKPVFTEDKTIGEGVVEFLRQSDDLDGLDKNITIEKQASINIKRNKEKDLPQDASKPDQLAFDITLLGNPEPERATLYLDLRGLDQGINQIVDKLDKELKDEDWRTNYSSPGTASRELSLLVGQMLEWATKYALEPNDDFTRPIHILNDAYQCYARGDEDTFVRDEYAGMTPTQLAEKRAHWTELMRGDTFKTVARDAVLLHGLEDMALYSQGKYPKLVSLLNVKLSADEADSQAEGQALTGSGLFRISYDGAHASLSGVYNLLFNDVNSLTSILQKTTPLISNIPGSAFAFIGDTLAELQQAMITDYNVPTDTKLSFRFEQPDTQDGGGIVPGPDDPVDPDPDDPVDPDPVDVSTLNMTVEDVSYTGGSALPVITLTDASGQVIDPSNYSVIYADPDSSKVGTYAFAIIGQGKYSGVVTGTYSILPPAPAVKRVSSGRKSFAVSWKKADQTTRESLTGYQVRYSTSKKFTKKTTKTKTVKKNTAGKVKVKGLKTKKVYYVKLRAYKDLGNHMYYSDWSEAKKVKTK